MSKETTLKGQVGQPLMGETTQETLDPEKERSHLKRSVTMMYTTRLIQLEENLEKEGRLAPPKDVKMGYLALNGPSLTRLGLFRTRQKKPCYNMGSEVTTSLALDELRATRP